MLDGRVGGAIIDGHVHLYDCFDIPSFLSAASDNLSVAADRIGRGRDSAAFLLLAESPQERAFARLLDPAGPERRDSRSGSGRRWHVHRLAADEAALVAVDNSDRTLTVIAGRQAETLEGLEVLALGTERTIAFGRPLSETIALINAMDAIAVIPWGAGKWLGRRGRVLRRFLESAGAGDVFLGDIAGRPCFWPRSAIFNIAQGRGIRVLPGTDPLPLRSETARVGTCAFYIDEVLSASEPTTALKDALRKAEVSIREYLRHESVGRFFQNQLAMRMRCGRSMTST